MTGTSAAALCELAARSLARGVNIERSIWHATGDACFSRLRQVPARPEEFLRPHATPRDSGAKDKSQSVYFLMLSSRPFI
jgi:hypothetical protein